MSLPGVDEPRWCSAVPALIILAERQSMLQGCPNRALGHARFMSSCSTRSQLGPYQMGAAGIRAVGQLGPGRRQGSGAAGASTAGLP